MATAALRPEDLEMDAADAILAHVRQAIATGALGVLGLGLRWHLWRMRRILDQLGRAVSTADVRTEADRKAPATSCPAPAEHSG